MATRCGSLRLPLLPSAGPSAAAPSSSVRPVGFHSGHGSGRKTSTPVSRVLATQAKAYLAVEGVHTKNELGNSTGAAALLALVADAATAVQGVLKAYIEAGKRSWPQEAEKALESSIINCRFFTLLGVAGTLVGSILCFVEHGDPLDVFGKESAHVEIQVLHQEGCSLIVEAYLEYFHVLWEKLNLQGEVMSLLIEALDMFLIGSAMLNFGMGLYIMFVGSRSGPKKYYMIGRVLPRVALSLHDKILPPSMQMRYISEAKAKLGHAVLTLLQSGVVDKLKGVPPASGLDLACFAGAILVSSAGIFLLSRLHMTKQARPQVKQKPDSID